MHTKHALAQALLEGKSLPHPTVSNLSLRHVNSIEREDGTNNSFNVTGINYAGAKVTFHVRTQD